MGDFFLRGLGCLGRGDHKAWLIGLRSGSSLFSFNGMPFQRQAPVGRFPGSGPRFNPWSGGPGRHKGHH